MKFLFVGDIHSNVNHLIKLGNTFKEHTVVQIGDFGIGRVNTEFVKKELPANVKFFVGNHDNRQLAKTIPNCLGDFGEFEGKFFFVSGAYSIDQADRTEGVSWWRDEELTYAQGQEALEQWEESKVDVLVTHDVPQSFTEGYFLIYDRCLTRNLLEGMIQVRKPKLLISGHHHKHIFMNVNGIEWRSLNIHEVLEVDI